LGDLNTPQVVLVDDDRAILKALSRMIELMGYEATTFDDPELALEHLETEGTGCLVVDLNMPGLSGLELQQSLASLPNPIPTVFVSGAATVQGSVAAMRGGATHFLEKPVEFDDLRAAIREAIADAKSQSRQDAGKRAARSKYEELSPRQKAVFHEVLTGAPNKVIAHRLGIAERTVKSHRQAIMQKLEADSLADAIAVGLALGMARGSTAGKG